MKIAISLLIICIIGICTIFYWGYRIRRGDVKWGYKTYDRYTHEYGYHMSWPFSLKRQPKPPRQREQRMWV